MNQRRNRFLFVLLVVNLLAACGKTPTRSPEEIIDDQQATITAQELKIVYLQQTNAAPSNGSIPVEFTPEPGGTEDGPPERPMPGETITVPTLPPPSNTLYFDDFSNNNNGWALSPTPAGSAVRSNGRLKLGSTPDSFFVIPVPNLSVDENYYIEADFEVVGDSSWIIFGFAFGPSPAEFYKFGVGGDGVYTYDPTAAGWRQVATYTEEKNMLKANSVMRLGLAASGGEYTLYVNGVEKESAILPIGTGQLGLFVLDTVHRTEVHVDNLAVYPSRP